MDWLMIVVASAFGYVAVGLVVGNLCVATDQHEEIKGKEAFYICVFWPFFVLIFVLLIVIHYHTILFFPGRLLRSLLYGKKPKKHSGQESPRDENPAS